MKRRRKFSAEFKAKVLLDAMTGELTLSELSSKYNVHSNIIAKWKKQARQGVVDSFSGKQKSVIAMRPRSKRPSCHDRQLTIENAFLQKAFARR